MAMEPKSVQEIKQAIAIITNHLRKWADEMAELSTGLRHVGPDALRELLTAAAATQGRDAADMIAVARTATATLDAAFKLCGESLHARFMELNPGLLPPDASKAGGVN